MNLRLPLAAGMMLCSVANIGSSISLAQSVQINLDKKIIYCDSLNMPVNTSALELMTLLPELLQRPGSMLLSNYEMKVQGMSINQGKDVALSNLLIEDIEKIEVSESPMSSYLNNGASGSINIVLRQHGSNTDNLWGNASLSASYPMDLAPQVLLSHRSERLVVHGLVLADIYNNNSSIENVSYGSNSSVIRSSRTDLENRYRTQLARAYLQFMPTVRDEIQLKLSQTYTYTRKNATPDYKAEKTERQHNRSTQLHALASYKHSFSPRTSLVLEGQYIYNPETSSSLHPEVQLLDRDNKATTAAGKVEFSTALLPASSQTTFRLITGSSFNGTFHKLGSSSYYYAHDIPYEGKQDYDTFFAQPYLRLELTAGKLRAKVEGQYQHFRYNLTNAGAETSVTCHDFTGMFVGEYHLTPHKNLRLLVNRSLNRPSAAQVNVLPVFDAQSSLYVIGNNSLLPSLSHEVRLDYITDYKWELQGLMFDASASYNHVSDIISSKVIGQQEALPGINLNCISYENGGHNDIVSANLMAMYNHKATTISLTGNVYHNAQCLNDYKNHFTYYNLSLYGQFRLQNGWQGSAKVAYYSQVRRSNATFSDCAVSTLSIAKSINRHFSTYVFARIAMQQKAEDTSTTTDGSCSIRRYEMATNAAGFGIRYSF